jgi:hypothetical protein
VEAHAAVAHHPSAASAVGRLESASSGGDRPASGAVVERQKLSAKDEELVAVIDSTLERWWASLR